MHMCESVFESVIKSVIKSVISKNGCHGMQATEAAYQEDDAVKAQMWYEHHDARYELWRRESEVRKQEQQQLQAHVRYALRQAHARKVKSNVCMKLADCAWKASNSLQCRCNS